MSDRTTTVGVSINPIVCVHGVNLVDMNCPQCAAPRTTTVGVSINPIVCVHGVNLVGMNCPQCAAPNQTAAIKATMRELVAEMNALGIQELDWVCGADIRRIKLNPAFMLWPRNEHWSTKP